MEVLLLCLMSIKNLHSNIFKLILDVQDEINNKLNENLHSNIFKLICLHHHYYFLRLLNLHSNIFKLIYTCYCTCTACSIIYILIYLN